MKKVFSFVFTFLLVNSGFAHAFGGTVENGGDVVYCRPFEESSSPKILDTFIKSTPYGSYQEKAIPYTHDYIFALMGGYKEESFVELESWSTSAERLIEIFESVSPRLANSFEKFRLSTDQIDLADRSIGVDQNGRSWEPILPKTKIYESKVPENFPLNCLISATENKLISFRYRAAHRWSGRFGENVEYIYNPALLRELMENSIQQYSFLLVHEWLWDHTNKHEVNQRVNAFLHSREIERMSSREIRTRLRRLGLKF